GPGAAAGVRIEPLPRAGQGLDLGAALSRLCALEVNELLVECGPRLAASWLASGLVDELIVYLAPMLLGADAPPLAALGAAHEAAGARFEFVDARFFGQDLRVILTAKREESVCSPGS
ncbi:MAG: dihydrofolate reductase family protein, partial [Gammaproteobacteria bacterium]|nr:dihydrofolate reductase family protein [Gammaproteobacteria bacterium]